MGFYADFEADRQMGYSASKTHVNQALGVEVFSACCWICVNIFYAAFHSKEEVRSNLAIRAALEPSHFLLIPRYQIYVQLGLNKNCYVCFVHGPRCNESTPLVAESLLDWENKSVSQTILSFLEWLTGLELVTIEQK